MSKKKLLLSLITAGAVLLLIISGGLDWTNGYWNDYLLQRGEEPDERIVVIGIDSYALDELGTWPWDRSVMADVLETLNQDPESRPAAIGLDVVYSGKTEPESDMRLAEAAAAGNVAVACTVEFDSSMVTDSDGNVYMDNFTADYLVLPFEELRENVMVGHVNAMYDNDGVLRHHLWQTKTLAHEVLPSLPECLYELYCRHMGLEADFQPKTDSHGFWWVDFSGKPGDYFAYSVADILNGDYDPDILADAIVLIGPYESTMSDDFVTASDHAQKMYGVEYMANVTAAILQGNQKAELSKGMQLAVLFFLCTFLGMVFLNCSSMLKIAAGSVASGAVSVALSLGLYRLGYITHSLWFLIGIAAVFLICIIWHYASAVLERHKIARTFQRYVDPAIIQELFREDTQSLGLTGKRMDIAVLFVDIRGFTTLSEQMEPEEIVTILNEYLTLTSHCIMEQKGTLDKYVGDCTMAFWGAPLPCEDPVYSACKAAMAMEQGVKVLQKQMMERYGKNVSFGIGVHYGPAVVGNIGAPERMDYTAIGDTVNTAARLEANAPAATVYISRKVADILGERAEVTSLGNSVKLKGKADGFEVLRLESLS